jgi:hypothetical protein
MTHPPAPPPGPLSRSYDDEVQGACRYERGLAVKGLIVLAIVAVLIVTHILWF